MKFEKIKGTPEQQANRRKLVDALRSGEYAQTQGVLRRGDSFCCLGVAADISGLGAWDGMGAYEIGKEELVTSLHHPDLENHYGFDRAGDFGAVRNVDDFTTLYSLNDSLGWSFDRIADFIEETWEVV